MLSGGTLSDEGGAFLLANPKVAKLKMLNLRHHYLSKEMQAKLTAFVNGEVDLSQAHRPEEDPYERYVEIGE